MDPLLPDSNKQLSTAAVTYVNRKITIAVITISHHSHAKLTKKHRKLDFTKTKSI